MSIYTNNADNFDIISQIIDTVESFYNHMNLSLEQLKSMVVFAQVIEQGSFSKAATHLNLSRAVVSYHVKKLETQLQIKLLNRSTRTLGLTQAGEVYYQSCRIIAEQASTAHQHIENVKKDAVGLLRITCPVNIGLQTIVPALNEFKNRYPQIELDIMLSDEVVNIMKEGIDLAIRGAPLVDSGLQATKLAVLPTCLCAAPSYLIKQGHPVYPADLAAHEWVIYKPASNIIELTKAQRIYSVAIKGSISTNNAAARTAFVEAGHGIGKIPLYDALPKIQAGNLERLLHDYSLSDIQVYGVYPPGTANTKKLRLLIDHLKEYFNAKQLGV